MEEGWDDWEAGDELPASSSDADAVHSATAVVSNAALAPAVAAESRDAAATAAVRSVSNTSAHPATLNDNAAGAATDEDDDDGTTDSDSDPWTWNFARMEREVRRLQSQPAKPSPTSSSDGAGSQRDDDQRLEHIMEIAEQVATDVHTGRARVVTLEALALVTKLHLLAVRRGFRVEQRAGDAAQQVPAIVARLRAIAPDWTIEPTSACAARQQLHELTAVLHHALTACSGDLAPFQQVLEQVMASQPRETLTVSVAWIRPSAPGDGGDKDLVLRDSLYLQHLEAITDPSAASPHAVAALTDAEVFQDAKDISRDELVVNGTLVAGTRGYSAIVETVQQHIERVLQDQIGWQRLDGAVASRGEDDAHTAATRAIAKQILNACNRTESGGSSYEILSKFLSNHAMDAILIRPDSAKAAPLAIALDVGAFEATSSSSGGDDKRDEEVWAFGVRAVLSAVTTYLVCDAADPTTELYEVKTTYTNRLAFPLGLTPFHPLNAMRKDCGSVEIQLVQPQPSPVALSPVVTTTRELTPAPGRNQEVDFDDLL